MMEKITNGTIFIYLMYVQQCWQVNFTLLNTYCNQKKKKMITDKYFVKKHKVNVFLLYLFQKVGV